jgi:hypothetical protein
MNATAVKHRPTRPIVKSFRLTEAHLRLITEECSRRRIPFSEFVRQSLLANLRYMKREAIAQWGNQCL